MAARTVGPTGRVIRVLAVLLLASFLAASPTRAQTPATLDKVEELTALGRVEEARTELLQWWKDSSSEATRRDSQRALWLRGRLTVDPGQANLDFRRLVIEYPGGPWSDQALLRLAQSAWAEGDSASARSHVARLVTEYPSSASRREAESWLASAGPLPPRQATSTATLPAAPAAPVAASASTTATNTEARGEVRYAIQLGAFSSDERARTLMDQARSARFEPRLVVVPGSPLLRVRAGSFSEEAEAREMAARAREAGLTALVVQDAHLEEPVGP